MQVPPFSELPVKPIAITAPEISCSKLTARSGDKPTNGVPGAQFSQWSPAEKGAQLVHTPLASHASECWLQAHGWHEPAAPYEPRAQT